MKKIKLAFLWHHHQPLYKNPSTGIYELPWVKLHATKDYFDTVAILDEFPKIKATFNLVPSLIEQIEEYASGTAKDLFTDITLKPATELSKDDKVFLLYNFFMANWKTMVLPNKRYKELLEKRGKNTSKETLKRVQAYFSSAEFRDLQVWFNLSWMDPYWKNNDELIKILYKKGRDFTEEEKNALVKKQNEICAKIIGKYKEVQDRGQIEVSTTPYFHPILPLLCDTNSARIATPDITLPVKRFSQKDDAQSQITLAIDIYEKYFGKKPLGMWPAEGSVSEEVVPLFANSGVHWIATDEEILYKTLSQQHTEKNKLLYKPYKVKIVNSEVDIIFRDRSLSDAIGFVYSKWNAESAVNDFIAKLHSIKNSTPDNEEPFVAVILDGENCWEHYANDGWDFLRKLYSALSTDPEVETVTIGKYLQNKKNKDTLPKLFAGSWIRGNFGVWIGHNEDNTAWQYLYDARKCLGKVAQSNPQITSTEKYKSAMRSIYAAEGSDWNWWFGDEHTSENDEIFDRLFREHLIDVYIKLGQIVPDYLHKPIKDAQSRKPTLEPVDLITPKIDGIVTNYFEWLAAGYYEVGHTGGSMHQVETLIRSFYYGFDLEKLYIRIDTKYKLSAKENENVSFEIDFKSPSFTKAFFELKSGGNVENFGLITLIKEQKNEKLTEISAKNIIELAIPLNKLIIEKTQERIEFCIRIYRNGLIIESWPLGGTVTLPASAEDFKLKSWSV